MLSEDFKSEVKEGNKVEVKSALTSYLVRNREDFSEALKYAKTNMDNFIDKYTKIGEAFENNPEKWNESYFNKQKVYLMKNFSEERIEHLLKVAIKLFPENITSKVNLSTNYSSSSGSTSRKTTTSRKSSDDDMVPKIAIGTGAVIAGVGLLTFKISLIAVGAVVVVGGAVYKYNKDN